MAERSVEGKVQPEGSAHVYDVRFSLPGTMLETAMASPDKCHTSRLTCGVKDGKVEMEYTVWCHPRTGWRHELRLVHVGPGLSPTSFFSFETRLWTKAPKRKYRRLDWKPTQNIFRSEVERKLAEKDFKRVSVTVKVKLLYMLPEELLAPKEDLAGKLLANVEESADVELQAQGFSVKAHSCILGMRSEILQAFFAKRWERERPFIFDLSKAAPENPPETVVRSVVKYCYTLEVPNIKDSPHKRAFLSLADGLQMESLFNDWSTDFKLTGLDDVQDVMTWPGLDSELPHVSALKKKVEEQAVQLGKKELEKHGLGLARDVLLAVKRRQEETGDEETPSERPEDGSARAKGLDMRREDLTGPHRKRIRRGSLRGMLGC